MRALEKEVLLQDVDRVIENSSINDRIDIATIVTTFAIVMFVFVLFLPKIFLSNNIYFESANIEMLKSRYYSLREENNILTSKIEKIRFNNRITH